MTKTLRIIGSSARRSVAPTERPPPPPPFLTLCPGLCAPVGGAIYPPPFTNFLSHQYSDTPISIPQQAELELLLSDDLGFC